MQEVVRVIEQMRCSGRILIWRNYTVERKPVSLNSLEDFVQDLATYLYIKLRENCLIRDIISVDWEQS